MQILFDDSLTETYEYPSEQSLMAATPAQPGDVDYEPDDLVHSTGLLVTPSIVAAGLFILIFKLLYGSGTDPISLLILFLFLLGQPRSKSLRLCCFRMDRDEIWHDCCSRKFLFIDLSHFYQRVSIASYANRWYSQRRNVRLSVCPSVGPSVTLWYCIKTKKASIMISSLSESMNIVVSRNIWVITKFERGHPERGRFMRLVWVTRKLSKADKPAR